MNAVAQRRIRTAVLAVAEDASDFVVEVAGVVATVCGAKRARLSHTDVEYGEAPHGLPRIPQRAVAFRTRGTVLLLLDHKVGQEELEAYGVKPHEPRWESEWVGGQVPRSLVLPAVKAAEMYFGRFDWGVEYAQTVWAYTLLPTLAGWDTDHAPLYRLLSGETRRADGNLPIGDSKSPIEEE